MSAANDDPAQLAALLAHELANPLSRIADALRVLREGDLGPDEHDSMLGIIERAVVQSQQVIERLRALHLSDEELAADVHPVDVVVLARRLVEELEPGVLAAHPTTVVGPEHLEWPVDPVGLRQILTNLLVNAARYSPRGREVTVAVEPGEETLRIVVRDRGHGVAPEDAERIFEMWERGDGGSGGLGLGLYVSRRIARAHGGDLRLEPAREEGATFVLELPRGGP